MTIASLLAVLATAASTPPLPPIRIEAVPNKGYAAIVGNFEPAINNAVNARITTLAQQKCGSLKVRFGRFFYNNGFTKDGRAQLQDYRQSFQCFNPATDPYKPVPADWKPSAQDGKDLLAFANAYFGALDRGDAKTGMPMMEPMIEITLKDWSDVPNRLTAFSGTGGTRKATIVGWINNPEGASHPGAYALVKLTSTYPKLAAYCGTLLVYRQGAGKYLVSQQDLRVIPQSWVDSGQVRADEAVKACEI